MLTQEQLQGLGDRAVAAVRAFETELVKMMAAQMANADLSDATARSLSRVTVMRKAQQLAKKHQPIIEKAVEDDLRAAFTQNLNTDLRDANASENGI